MNQVINTNICQPYDFSYPKLNTVERRQKLSEIFEQLLLFDKVVISTNRINFSLAFLINEIGLNSVERLIEANYIKFMIWTPVLFTGLGNELPDGTYDESELIGKPPIVSGTFSDEDLNAEKNIHYALSNFGLHKDVIKGFTKKALNNYIIPNGMLLAQNSEKLILDSYINNNLEEIGLPYEKEPTQLNIDERNILLNLGYKVLETSLLTQYDIKSYNNFESLKIVEKNFSNIGKAFNVSNNTTDLLNIENVPSLKELFISERLDFDSVFKIRHYSSAKYFRKWINKISENQNAQKITEEYLNEIKGKTKFFESPLGKFTKNLGLYAFGYGLGQAVAGQIGGIVGSASSKIIEPAVDYGLGLLETYWLDDLFKGKNPSMFIESLKKDIRID